jgi:hypothetical protein
MHFWFLADESATRTHENSMHQQMWALSHRTHKQSTEKKMTCLQPVQPLRPPCAVPRVAADDAGVEICGMPDVMTLIVSPRGDCFSTGANAYRSDAQAKQSHYEWYEQLRTQPTDQVLRTANARVVSWAGIKSVAGKWTLDADAEDRSCAVTFERVSVHHGCPPATRVPPGPQTSKKQVNKADQRQHCKLGTQVSESTASKVAWRIVTARFVHIGLLLNANEGINVAYALNFSDADIAADSLLKEIQKDGISAVVAKYTHPHYTMCLVPAASASSAAAAGRTRSAVTCTDPIPVAATTFRAPALATTTTATPRQ